MKERIKSLLNELKYFFYYEFSGVAEIPEEVGRTTLALPFKIWRNVTSPYFLVGIGFAIWFFGIIEAKFIQSVVGVLLLIFGFLYRDWRSGQWKNFMRKKYAERALAGRKEADVKSVDAR